MEDGERRGVGAAVFFIGLEEAGIEEAAGFEVAEGAEQGGLEVRVLLFEFVEDGAERAADGSGPERAAARDDRGGGGTGPGARQVFGDVEQRADETELASAGPDDGRQGSQPPGEHGVAKEGLAEVVGSVPQGDDVGAEFARQRVDGAAPEPAAKVTAVIGLIGEQAERGIVAVKGPGDVVVEHPLAEGLDGGEELALIDGEGAKGEMDGGALLKDREGREEGEGVLPAGKTNGDAVAVTDHPEARNRLPHTAEYGFFELQISIVLVVSPARRTAYEVLKQVERGAKSDMALLEAACALDSRDAGLATEIVYGVLRRRAQLDWLIGRASARRLEELDEAVLRVLRMGAYQLRFLTRVPAHAVVDESVELVKQAGRRQAAGFVNAVLRRLPPLPDRWASEELEYSMPGWLLERWKRTLGEEDALRAARAGLEAPQRAELDGLPMDEGAQAIVPLLELKAGDRMLDVCAAPGNKTRQALAGGARVVACDASWRRLRGLLAECPRVQARADEGLPFAAVFDKVLVDAPCTGTGTLARNPEIRWRVTEAEIARQARRQEEILREALRCLKPGGRLVYATCSLEREENEDVVERVAGRRVKKTMLRVPGRERGDGFFAAVIE